MGDAAQHYPIMLQCAQVLNHMNKSYKDNAQATIIDSIGGGEAKISKRVCNTHKYVQD